MDCALISNNGVKVKYIYMYIEYVYIKGFQKKRAVYKVGYLLTGITAIKYITLILKSVRKHNVV